MRVAAQAGLLLGAAVVISGCSSTPASVPSASAFAAPSVKDPSAAGQVKACASSADRAKQVACLVPLAEELLAKAYAPVVESRGLTFTRPRVSLAEGGAQTECGKLASVSYCPQDGTIVLPLGKLVTLGDRSATAVEWGPKSMAYFKKKLTAEQLRSGGAYGAVTALAHEYGHHVQSLLGYEQLNTELMKSDPNKAAYYSSEFELMADCFAGWTTAVLNDGGAYDIKPIDQWAAVTALAEVGDDFIQENRGGATSVKPAQSFNHGAANERANAWVRGVGLGYDKAEPYQACLTLADELIAGRPPAG